MPSSTSQQLDDHKPIAMLWIPTCEITITTSKAQKYVDDVSVAINTAPTMCQILIINYCAQGHTVRRGKVMIEIQYGLAPLWALSMPISMLGS